MVPYKKPIKIEEHRESPALHRNVFQGSPGIQIGTNQRKNLSPLRQETALLSQARDQSNKSSIIPS